MKTSEEKTPRTPVPTSAEMARVLDSMLVQVWDEMSRLRTDLQAAQETIEALKEELECLRCERDDLAAALVALTGSET